MKNIYGGVIDLYLQDRDPLQCVHSPPWQPGPKPPPEHTDQEMFRSSLKVRTDCSASGSEDTITLNIPRGNVGEKGAAGRLLVPAIVEGRFLPKITS